MTLSQQDLACFVRGRDRVIEELRDRLIPYKGQKKAMSKAQCEEFVDELIATSYNNWRTKMYDKLQYCCQGIR